MFTRLGLSVALTIALATGARTETVSLRKEGDAKQERPSKTKELLTDAAIVVLIIAASIGDYKAKGKPCACPNDTMRNGARCGNRSAWAKPGGYKPCATRLT
jgi:hypothetical protein